MTRNFLFLSVAIVAASLPTIGLSAETTSPAWGVDLSAMDRKVDPGDDFYRYVNGTWLASAQIPPDRGSIGIWTNLMDSADEEILAILADLAPAPGKQGPTGKKVYDFYSSYMDTDTIEANGLKSLKPLLAEINAVSNRRALMAVMAKHEMSRPITIGVLNDPGDASHYITAIAQGGITLPSAEYYSGERRKPRQGARRLSRLCRADVHPRRDRRRGEARRPGDRARNRDCCGALGTRTDARHPPDL